MKDRTEHDNPSMLLVLISGAAIAGALAWASAETTTSECAMGAGIPGSPECIQATPQAKPSASANTHLSASAPRNDLSPSVGTEAFNRQAPSPTTNPPVGAAAGAQTGGSSAGSTVDMPGTVRGVD